MSVDLDRHRDRHAIVTLIGYRHRDHFVMVTNRAEVTNHSAAVPAAQYPFVISNSLFGLLFLLKRGTLLTRDSF